jgi:hypothetical protein
MITKYDIINEAAATIGMRSSPDDIRRLERLLNKILVSLSERHSFHLLRRKMKLDLSTSSTESGQEGIWLPANMAGIDAVQDVHTGVYYVRRETDAIGNVETGMPRYSVYTPGLAPLFWADDVRIDRGSKNFTSVLLDQNAIDYTGEWIRLGNDPQFYKLTGERQLSETYWGESLSYADMTIRPTSQKKLIVHNSHDEQLQSGEVYVHYWVYHPLMYRDSDELLLPHPRLVELMMMKEAKGSLGRRARDPLNGEIDAAWKETSRLNPSFYIPSNPLDRVGNSFDPSKIYYDRRGRNYERKDWR